MGKSEATPADVAYARVREVCLAFPGADEKLPHGAPAFHVRGKLFLTFQDNHHGDGRVAVWCKATPAEQRPATAQRALERLTAICLRLPEAVCERESRHATFRVRKKVFAYFLYNHHGDGVISACFKGDPRENAALVRDDPARFFLPAYIGPRGWLGMRVDRARVDWKEVRERVHESYRAVAPQGLAGLGTPARARRPGRLATAAGKRT